MKRYNKIKNYQIKHIINMEIKRHKISNNIGAVKILKNIGQKYY